MTKLPKRIGKLSIVTVIGLALGLVYLNHRMAKKDAEFQKFYTLGAEIKNFAGAYGVALAAAFKTHGMTPVAPFYANTYPESRPHQTALKRGRWVWQPGYDGPDVSSQTLEAAPPWITSKTAVIEDLANYLKGMSSIDEIRSKIDMIENFISEHRVVLRVKFILDGTTHQGQRFQDRHFYRWEIRRSMVNDQPTAWKIVNDELVDGVRVVGNGLGFRELDLGRAGLDYRHARNPKLDKTRYGAQMKFDLVEHAAGGVSVVDYNDDGWPDIFFADGKRSRLYRNNGAHMASADHVTFTDVTREAGLDGIDQAHSGIFADIDNDGHQDLFITRYLAPNKLYRSNGDGTFTERSAAMGLDAVMPSTSAVFLDYDLDGDLDLYVGAFGNAFNVIPRTPFFALNGAANRLYQNHDGKRFSDVTRVSGVGDTGWSLAVTAADYDDDGYPDLAVANDFGRKNLYHNNRDGTFTEVAKQAGVLDFSAGMGVVFGDINNDGKLDLYTSNINSNQRWFGEDITIRQYIRNVVRTKWAVLDMGEYLKLYKLVGSSWTDLGKLVGEGNSLFQNNGDGTFSELKTSRTNRAGWGWGVAFVDVDNDGDQDIYAANGWISNTPGTDL